MSTLSQKVLAWAVHLFTSLGLLSAFMAIVAIDQLHWRSAFIWLLICFIIDSLDGTLARRYDVENVLPYMDGKSIDFVIDFAAYAIIPTYFFYKAGMADDIFMPICIIVMLLSSALYYGKKNMVVQEQYFMGFPVLWNFVVFYQFFIFQNTLWLNTISVLLFGMLHFAPLRFAYPSRTKKFFKVHLMVSILGLIATLGVLYFYPSRWLYLEIIAGFGSIYFILFAFYDTIYSS